jgi:dynactin complex subunit
MTVQTKEQRLAIIKAVAERRKNDEKISRRMSKLKEVKAKTRRVPSQVKVKRDYMDIPTESNIYAYTDQSKYAKQYYGETLYETTRFDNDWD